MVTALWIAQGVLGLGFIGALYTHGFRSVQMKVQVGGRPRCIGTFRDRSALDRTKGLRRSACWEEPLPPIATLGC